MVATSNWTLRITTFRKVIHAKISVFQGITDRAMHMDRNVRFVVDMSEFSGIWGTTLLVPLTGQNGCMMLTVVVFFYTRNKISLLIQKVLPRQQKSLLYWLLPKLSHYLEMLWKVQCHNISYPLKIVRQESNKYVDQHHFPTYVEVIGISCTASRTLTSCLLMTHKEFLYHFVNLQEAWDIPYHQPTPCLEPGLSA